MQKCIWRALRYTKKGKGRTLRVHVPEFDLMKHDRLEPCPELLDVGDFEHKPPPFNVFFWRIRRESRITHHSPLLDIPGDGLDNYCIDLLHSWVLGPIQAYVGFVLWFIISQKVLVPDIAYLSAEDNYQLAILQIRAKLFEHYRRRSHEDPHFKEKGSKIWNLTLGMLGQQHDPTLNAKAAEIHGVLLFVIELLEEHIGSFKEDMSDKATYLLQAGRCAREFDNILNSSGRLVSEEVQTNLFHNYMRHVMFYDRAGGKLHPKHHLMIHLIQRVVKLGNPKLYASYRDESLNGVVARLAQNVHSAAFGDQIHFRFGILRQLGLKQEIY
jgi:hypothetical protein